MLRTALLTRPQWLGPIPTAAAATTTAATAATAATTATTATAAGRPLEGVTVLELEGLAVAPMVGMILADQGARVIRIDRPPTSRSVTSGRGADAPGPHPGTTLTSRGKQSVVLDLKEPSQADVLIRLAAAADVLIEPYRAGVMEALGLGPDVFLGPAPEPAAPGLIYARVTGYGQSGALASAAGHDINYLARSGLLAACARAVPHPTQPTPPLNLLADMAGGALTATLGITLALVARGGQSGGGTVVDANMVSGAAYLGSFLYGMAQAPPYGSPMYNPAAPGTNLLDSGAPFYDTYATADGLYVAVGAIEPKFFAVLLDGLGLGPDAYHPASQYDPASWPALRVLLADVFLSKTQAEWAAVFDGSDACVSPVPSIDQLLDNPDPQLFGREATGATMPLPAPSFSHPGSVPGSGTEPPPDTLTLLPPRPDYGADTKSVLSELTDMDAAAIDALCVANGVSPPPPS